MAQQSYAAEQLNQQYADIGYQQELGNRAEQQRQGVRNTAEGMIGSGLLRSGYHNRTQTENLGTCLRGLDVLGTQKSGDDARRAATMAAILANLGLDINSESASAAERYAAVQRELAATSSGLAGTDVGTAPATSGGTTYSADAIQKAKAILANQSGKTKEAIAWARKVLGR